MSPLETMVTDTLWQVNTFGVHWDMAVQMLPSHVLATEQRLAQFHRITDAVRAELDEIGPLGIYLGEQVLAKVRQEVIDNVCRVLAGAFGQALAGGLGWYNAILSTEGEIWAKHIVIDLCHDVPEQIKREGATAVLEAASEVFASTMKRVPA